MIRWPFMLRSTADALRTENAVLRDALTEISNELHRYKLLLAGIKAGADNTTTAVSAVVDGMRKMRAKS
jgi:hypothetical protein